MNPQPEPYLGNIVALAIVASFFYFYIKACAEGTKINCEDLFTIGYIEEDNAPIINVQQSVSKQASPDFESQQLYVDCIDALHSIGFKKAEAKKRAKQIFSSMKNPPTNIQDFLMIALRKDS